MSDQHHWDGIYGRLDPEALSWHQPRPEVSLALIDAAGVSRDQAVIDVGGGASTLVDELVAGGFADLTVLDVSAVALERSRVRLGAVSERVYWICTDVCDWEPERTYDLWHDRAVFHFLVDPGDPERYVQAATSALGSGAHLVMGTFGPTAPPRCSGRPVSRYDVAGLADALGPAFSLLEARAEEHVTPRGTVQPFTWAVFQRR